MNDINSQFSGVATPPVESVQTVGFEQTAEMSSLLPQRQVYQQQQARPNAALIAHQASLQRG